MISTPDYTAELNKLLLLDPSTTKIRETALAAFAKIGVPNRKNDSWRYSNIQTNLLHELKLSTNCQQQDELTFWQQLSDAKHSCYLQNGNATLPADSILQLAVNPIINTLTATNAFANLNVALANCCNTFTIPANTNIETPILLLHVLQDKQQIMTHPQTKIIIGENANVTIIEGYIATNNTHYLCNATTHIDVASNAKLRHILWYEANNNLGYIIGRQQINLHSNSCIDSNIHAINPQLLRCEYHIASGGKNATATVQALAYSNNNSSYDLDLLLDHKHDNGVSKATVRTLGQNGGKVNCTGKITVNPNAKNCDANLDCKSLILDDTAIANNRPQLEIYNDEVKCAHGCSVGKLDQTALYYLQSRGIDLATAKSLLIASFMYPALKLPLQLQQRLYNAYNLMDLT